MAQALPPSFVQAPPSLHMGLRWTEPDVTIYLASHGDQLSAWPHVELGATACLCTGTSWALLPDLMQNQDSRNASLQTVVEDLLGVQIISK